MSFGKYPEVSLRLARERHSDGRKLLATGADPMAERKAAKVEKQASTVNSFASLAADFLDHWQAGKCTRHVDMVRRRTGS